MAVDRSRLPEPGPEPAFAFPAVSRRVLGNGIRVMTAEHRKLPVIAFLALVPAGASADPADRHGLAAVTGDLLDEGCGDLDALAFHDALARIGAQIETEVGADATLVGVTVLERFAPRGVQLLAEAVIRPRLERHEFERVRDLRLNRLKQLRELPPAIAERAFVRMVYGDHPYGHLAIGSDSSLRAMSLDDVHGFHRRAYAPSHTTIVAVGDASHDRLAELVEQGFAAWMADPGASSPPRSGGDVPVPPGERRLALVHRPGAAQSELRMGHVGAPRRSPDYHALLVLNMVLGGQFVSRINMNLREDKGYTYGARSSFDFRRGPGPFVVQASVQSDATSASIREVLRELRAIRGERPVTRKELELGRAGLTRGYPRLFETADQVARGVAQLALYDLPDDYFSTFVPTVLALTEDQVTDAAQRHLDPDRLVTVVVGDRHTVGDLAAAGAGEPADVMVEV